ncbi:hypothetical protein ACOSQ2_010601 [Xanthoceras sorbifolium]
MLKLFCMCSSIVLFKGQFFILKNGHPCKWVIDSIFAHFYELGFCYLLLKVKAPVIYIFSTGKKCKLLHWMGNGEVVAETEVDCTDPQAMVHHMILGADYWRVCVKKILVSKIPLYCATTKFMMQYCRMLLRKLKPI